MAALFEFTYGNNTSMKIIGLLLVLAYGFAVYYLTLPDSGLIKLRTLDDYPFLKETFHFLMFIALFLYLGPKIINAVPVGGASSFGRR